VSPIDLQQTTILLTLPTIYTKINELTIQQIKLVHKMNNNNLRHEEKWVPKAIAHLMIFFLFFVKL